MILVIKILLNSIFIILLSILVTFLPFYFIFTKENVKQILHSTRVYEGLLIVSQQRWLDEVNTQDSHFSTIVKNHVNEIVTQEWFTYIGNTIVDEGFESFYSKKGFTDKSIDISPVKRNFLQHLEKTELQPTIPDLQKSIPDTVSISNLLKINVLDISALLFEVRSIYHVYIISTIMIGILLIVIILLYILYMPLIEAISQLTKNIVFIGILFLLVPLVFQYGILSTPVVEHILGSNESMWYTLGVTVGLTFFEKLVHFWSWEGLLLFSLSFIGFIQVYIKQKVNTYAKK